MRKNSHSKDIKFANRFCNALILDLVQNELLSESQARSITQEQFESSALSVPYIQGLVYKRKMLVVTALFTKRETYFNSGLSSRYVQVLVECHIMSIGQALLIARDEVENPVPYLTQLGDRRTPEQNRKLFLYESDPTITPEYVEHIVLLEFQKGGRDAMDERELELLRDPSLRRYAVHIVNLEFCSEKSAQTHRELELIFSRYSRPYFNLIVDLEFKENKSVDEEIYLENLYLRVCCRMPRKNPIYSLFQSVLREDIGPQGCHDQLYFGYSGGFNMIQHDATERRQMEQMKLVFEKTAKDIVMVELDMRVVPVKLRQTEAMQQYVLSKTDLVRHALLKYFVGHDLPYSKNALDELKEKIIQKIQDKSLTLSHADKLLSLRSWIDEVAMPCKLD